MRSRGTWLLGALGLCACAHFAVVPRAELPEDFSLHLPEGKALRVQGRLHGPLQGLGTSLEFGALLSSEAGARIDLHYELDHAPQHDVILWTPDAILRFDRRAGGVQELGDGELELAGARLHLAHVALLALGREFRAPPGAEYRRRGSRIQLLAGAVHGEIWGPDGDGKVRKVELRWSENGEGRRLTSHVEQWQSGEFGVLPRLLELGGHGIRGRATLEMEAQIVDLEEVTDFDPMRGG